VSGLLPIPRIVDAKRIVDAELAENLQRIVLPIQKSHDSHGLPVAHDPPWSATFDGGL
jgi:hypothetical protein